jgi:hypothetical protein
MQQRAKTYQIVGNELYKTSISGPLLRCLSKAEGLETLRKSTQESADATLAPAP